LRVTEALPQLAAPFARLADLFAQATHAGAAAIGKEQIMLIRRALLDPSVERAAMAGEGSAVERLSALARLHQLAASTPLAARDREDVLEDIDRLAMRLLSSERIVEGILTQDATTTTRAAALLTLLARGVLPAGAAARSVLEKAKALLTTPEAVKELRESGPMRQRILELLALSEGKARLAA
jgi:hypothetical protein